MSKKLGSQASKVPSPNACTLSRSLFVGNRLPEQAKLTLSAKKEAVADVKGGRREGGAVSRNFPAENPAYLSLLGDT